MSVKFKTKISSQVLILLFFFFSIPPIFTWDSGQYLELADIFSNPDRDFSQWDIVRGFGFPFVSFIFLKIFGYTYTSILSFLFLSYLCIYIVVKKIIFINTKKGTQKILYFSFLFFFVLDTLTFLIYHVYLTEFFAATLFALSVLLSYFLLTANYYENKLKFIFIALFFILMSPISYQIKQPVVINMYMPLLCTIVVMLIHKNKYIIHQKINFYLKLGIVFASFFSVILVQKAWSHFLISTENPLPVHRDVEKKFLKPRFLNFGFYYDGQDKIKLSDNNTVIKVLTKDQIQTFQDNNNSKSSFKEVFFFLFLIKNTPFQYIKAVTNRYLKITTILPPQYYEKEAIAYRSLSATPPLVKYNTFFAPPYESFLGPMRVKLQTDSITIRIAKFFKSKSDFLFKYLLAFAPIFSLLAILTLIVRNKFTKLFFYQLFFIFIINTTITISILSYAIVNFLIDRYAFPVYPMSICSFLLILSLIYNYIKIKIPFNHLRKIFYPNI